MRNEIYYNSKKYKIECEYPNSGQKKVYKVKDEAISKHYIIKVIKYRDIKDISRTYRETEILEKINSEYFAKIYGQNIDTSNKEYLILEEYIEGNTLREKILDYKNDENECIKVFKEIIIGMKILWEQNIIHRDLKPENIIIKPNGKPVILDLGIIKCLNENAITELGQRMPYTAKYCAPEQYRNEGHLISQRTDFFILGIVLGEMYNGEYIFLDQEGEVNILGEYQQTENVKINGILKKLLAKEPFKRFRDENIILKYIASEWGGI